MRTTLAVKNCYHRLMPNVPVTFGVPLPEGAVRTANQIALLDVANKPMPVSVTPWAKWRDGSIRWALLDFAANLKPNEKASLTLALGEGVKTPKIKSPVVVKKTPRGFQVSNGALVATFDRSRFRLFDTLKADGIDIITQANRSDLVAIAPAGKIHRASYDTKPKLSIEDSNGQRAVIRWDGGLFSGDGNRLTEFRVKITFFAGNPYVKIEHSAICREMPERGVFMREYRIELETAMDQRTTKTVNQMNHGYDYFSRLVDLTQNVRIKVPTTGQDAHSAGAVGVLGTVGKSLIEDEASFKEDVASFPHFLKPGAPRVAIGGGYGLVFPYLGVRDSKRTIVASILRANAQHPKGLSADENKITLDIWPAGYGEWRLSRGMTKTHHLAISFFGAALTPEQIDAEAVRREFFAYNPTREPLEITLDPQYVRLTRQLDADRMLPYLPEKYPKLETKLGGVKLHGDPLAHSGMMDYGEAIATNNEEDQGYSYVMEYVRAGNFENFSKMVAQMLHNSTVDVVDWDPDPLRMGGTPYHTSYHQDSVCVPSHFWTEGMFAYAYMTGDREAYRAAIGLCDWALRMMKGRPRIVKQDGREIGWPIIALTAGYEATGEARFRKGAFELVSYYHEKIAQHGFLANNEPPGTGYLLTSYGEYAGFEGMHKLWRATGDEALRKFASKLIGDFIDQGHISFYGHGRMMDLYAIYAVHDMTGDKKWIEVARKFAPIALARPNWNGYFYRRLIQFLGMCHEHGLLDDSQVVLSG